MGRIRSLLLVVRCTARPADVDVSGWPGVWSRQPMIIVWAVLQIPIWWTPNVSRMAPWLGTGRQGRSCVTQVPLVAPPPVHLYRYAFLLIYILIYLFTFRTYLNFFLTQTLTLLVLRTRLHFLTHWFELFTCLLLYRNYSLTQSRAYLHTYSLIHSLISSPTYITYVFQSYAKTQQQVNNASLIQQGQGQHRCAVKQLCDTMKRQIISRAFYGCKCFASSQINTCWIMSRLTSSLYDVPMEIFADWTCIMAVKVTNIRGNLSDDLYGEIYLMAAWKPNS